MHQAASQCYTLFCNHHAIQNVSRAVLSEFVRVLYQPKHMVVVGVVFKRARLEQLAVQVFETENWKAGWSRICTRDWNYVEGVMDHVEGCDYGGD